MKRFFGELNILMRRRRHLLFLIIIWSLMSVTAYAFSKGLEKTTDNAFGKLENPREYTYEFEILDRQLTQVKNAAALQTRMKLNKMLSESEEFGYYSFHITKGTVTELAHPEIAVSEGSSYQVPVIFLDKGCASQVQFAPKLEKLFAGDLDYDAVVPVLYGNKWIQEMPKMTVEGGYSVSGVSIGKESGWIDYKTSFVNFVNTGNGENMINLGGKSINLENYIIMPLRDVGSSNSGNENANDIDRKAYWCNIYDLRNQGIIVTDLKPDSLQKRINELLEKNGLNESFSIKVQDADYESKILFNDNLDKMKIIVKDVAIGALAITAMMLLLYVLFSVARNQRYEFLAYINGTGKIEFWCLHMIQVVFWLIFTVAPAYGLYIGMMRIMNISFVELKVFLDIPLKIALAAACAVTLRLFFWDTGKILRRV